MVHYDDNFEPYWLDEKDWLVEVIMLPKDEDLVPFRVHGKAPRLQLDYEHADDC
jgi:hypothetical protein